MHTVSSVVITSVSLVIQTVILPHYAVACGTQSQSQNSLGTRPSSFA